VNPLAGQDMRLDQLVERRQPGSAGADMIGHGRHRELNPLARMVLALPIERLMVGVLLDQHHCQQARAGKAAGDRVEGRGRLRDRLARPAAELLPHMLGHEPLPRDDIERLSDILADLRELGAAAARTRGRRGVNDAPARQLGRKVAPCRRALRKALHLDRGRGGLGLVLPGGCGEFLKLQLQLIDQPLTALGTRTEHLALHLGDHQLQVLDYGLRAGELGARLDERCLQRIYVVGELVRCPRHESTESQNKVIRESRTCIT
jgi:hypothetical protein